MQTFLPFPDFKASAIVLDRARLGRQRTEALILLRGLSGTGPSGWRHHPAWKMWQGHEFWLAAYGITICDEWVSRGYRDSCAGQFTSIALQCRLGMTEPPWLGDKAFHLSHQSNLLRKNAGHYERFFAGVPATLPYVWPS